MPLPFITGRLADSQGALFYFDPAKGYYRLTTGSTTLDSLGALGDAVQPTGPGLWVQSSGGKSAQYFTQAGSPQATLQIGGNLVGGGLPDEGIGGGAGARANAAAQQQREEQKELDETDHAVGS